MGEINTELLKKKKSEIAEWYSDFIVSDYVFESYSAKDENVSLEQREYNKVEKELLNRVINFFPEVLDEYMIEVVNFYYFFIDFLEFDSFTSLPEQLKTACFFLCLFDCKPEPGKTVMDLFRDRKQEELDERESLILLHWQVQLLNLYEIKEACGNRYLLEPVFLSEEEEYEIVERDIKLSSGGLLLGRVCRAGEEFHLIGPFEEFPIYYKKPLLEHINHGFEKYKKETDVYNFRHYLRDCSAIVFCCFLRIKKVDDVSINRLYEARYNMQSRKVVSKKLLSQPDIVKDKSIKDFECLVWIPENGNQNLARGNFLLNGNEFLVRSHRYDLLQKGCEYVEGVLSFLISFDKEYEFEPEFWGNGFEINFRTEEESKRIIEEYLRTPMKVEVFGEKTPLELV